MVSEGWSQRYIWTNLLSTIVRNEISMAHAEVGMKGSNLKNSKQTNSTSAILPIRLAFPLTLGHPTIHHPFLVTRDFNISMALAEAAPPRENIMKTLEFNQHLSGDLDISFPPAHGIISKIFNLQTSKEDPNIHWKEVWRCCNLGIISDIWIESFISAKQKVLTHPAFLICSKCQRHQCLIQQTCIYYKYI